MKRADAHIDGIKIFHPKRIIDSQRKVTRLEFAHLYHTTFEWLLLYIQGRSVFLLPAPEGIDRHPHVEVRRFVTFLF